MDKYDEVVISYGMKMLIKKRSDEEFWYFLNRYWHTTLFIWAEIYSALVRQEMPKIESLAEEQRVKLRLDAINVCLRTKTEANLLFFEKIVHCVNHLT